MDFFLYEIDKLNMIDAFFLRNKYKVVEKYIRISSKTNILP